MTISFVCRNDKHDYGKECDIYNSYRYPDNRSPGYSRNGYPYKENNYFKVITESDSLKAI